MTFRVLTVLAVLVLPPLAEAAEGLFHLCHDSVQLNFTCCCDHEREVQQPQRDACLSGEHANCCGELKVQQAVTPASTAPSGQSWMPLPLMMVLQPVLRVPPAPEPLLPAWVSIHGVHRSTAPPLYIQHCSYLK